MNLPKKKYHNFRVGMPSKTALRTIQQIGYSAILPQIVFYEQKCETQNCNMAKFLLHNLRNATFRYFPLLEVESRLEPNCNITLKEASSLTENGKYAMGVQCNILQLFYSKVYPRPEDPLYVDLSPAIAFSGDCIMSSVATNTRDDSESLSLLVLDNYVLAFTVTAILFVSAVAFLFSVILKKQKANLVSFFKHIWIFVADILQNQDLSVLGQQLHTLLLVGAWIMGSLVICKGYAGSISSNMVVSIPKPINTIEDVLERKNMIPFIVRRSKLHNYLQKSQDINHKKLISRADKMKSYFDESIENFSPKNIKNFREGKSVIFYSRRYQNMVLKELFFKFFRKSHRKIYLGDATYETRPLHYFLSKGLDRDVRENAVYLILRYLETDQDMTYEASKARLYGLALLKKTSSIYPTKALTMQFLWSGFRIYFICIAISILSLVMEGIYYNR